MSKFALGSALALLFIFTYLLGVKPGYTLAYALILLFVLAWLWPRYTARRLSLSRHLDPGTPTVGDQFEEVFTISRRGWVPAPWVEVRDLGQVTDYQPGRVVSAGGEPITWRARGAYRRRGWMTFRPTSVRGVQPFGPFRPERRLKERTSVLLYPRIRPIPDRIATSAQQPGSSPAARRWGE